MGRWTAAFVVLVAFGSIAYRAGQLGPRTQPTGADTGSKPGLPAGDPLLLQWQALSVDAGTG